MLAMAYGYKVTFKLQLKEQLILISFVWIKTSSFHTEKISVLFRKWISQVSHWWWKDKFSFIVVSKIVSILGIEIRLCIHEGGSWYSSCCWIRFKLGLWGALWFFCRRYIIYGSLHSSKSSVLTGVHCLMAYLGSIELRLIRIMKIQNGKFFVRQTIWCSKENSI